MISTDYIIHRVIMVYFSAVNHATRKHTIMKILYGKWLWHRDMNLKRMVLCICQREET